VPRAYSFTGLGRYVVGVARRVTVGVPPLTRVGESVARQTDESDVGGGVVPRLAVDVVARHGVGAADVAVGAG